MADTETNVPATPDEPGTNDAGTEGTPTPSVQPEETPKTFTQAELDQIIKARLAEKERTLKSKFEKDLDTKLATAREDVQKDLDKLVEDRVVARLAEQELAKTRTSIMQEYGLSEDQAARLQGASAEELQKDAETIYGALKQLPRPKPPILKPGEGSSVESPLDISKMTPAQIREKSKELWPGR